LDGLEGELLPGDRTRALQHKTSRQMLEAHLVEASDGVVALKQAKQAEQVEIETCGCHPFASV
jgi:hypothetical protein